MGRDSDNKYRRARLQAANSNGMFSSMGKAAQYLYISKEALHDYETGSTIPPCDVVQRMIEVYHAHELRREHICDQCPLMEDYAGGEPSELTQAALGWIASFSGIQGMAEKFCVVARDGKITYEEERTALAVRKKAEEVMQLMQETITAIDKSLSRGGHVCDNP